MPRPTIDALMPPTVPVKVGLAMGAFEPSAVDVAEDNGLAASEVLSTLLRLTCAFVKPVSAAPEPLKAVAVTVPLTSSLEAGVVVPIPMLLPVS